jgi:KTSC domain-containing protein
MNLPDMHPVSSSNVDSVGYDQESETLYVRFKNETLYEYRNVPVVVFEQLMSAPSVGSYMHRNIKNVYPYDRVG